MLNINKKQKSETKLKLEKKRKKLGKPIRLTHTFAKAKNSAVFRTARKSLKAVPYMGTGLVFGDSELIRLITKFDLAKIATNNIDGLLHIKDAASYIINNPKEVTNELFGEGLIAGIRETAVTLHDNISLTGHVIDPSHKAKAWIADSLGAHKVSYIDENGESKLSIEKQEYIYSYVPYGPDSEARARLFVYRPAEGLTDQTDANGEKIREFLRVPVAEFDIQNDRVTYEVEYNSDGTKTIHSYNDENPQYQHLQENFLKNKIINTNEIFARFGMPETKVGNYFGQKTATDVLKSIKIGKRISSQTYGKGETYTVIDWDNSQDDKLVFAEIYEQMNTKTSARSQSAGIVMKNITKGTEYNSVSYEDLKELGININGDKNDLNVRTRILKDISKKLHYIRATQSFQIIQPYQETTQTNFQYYRQTVNYIKNTEDERSDFFSKHPLFGQRDNTYISEIIDYNINEKSFFDKDGNIILSVTFDNPSQYNHYQYIPNNIFIPTNTDGINMQFAPTGEFLGFQSDEHTANLEKLKRLLAEKELLQNFDYLKKTLGVKTLPEIRNKLNQLSKTEDVSAWVEIVNSIEHYDLKNFDAQVIDVELEKFTAKNEQFEKQFTELKKKHIQRNKDGNIRISTKYHPLIIGKEIVVTNENNKKEKIIKINQLTGYPLTFETSEYKSHRDFPIEETDTQEFYSYMGREGNFDYYRINYNGTPNTQNYGGYVKEDAVTGICHTFNRHGNCIYIDVPNGDINTDENWAYNSNSDRYKRIYEMIIESDKGGVFSNNDVLEMAKKHKETNIPFDYFSKLAKYEHMLKEPLRISGIKNQYIRLNTYTAELIKKELITDTYIDNQLKCLSELETILNGIPKQTAAIKTQKEALKKQRNILKEMYQKPIDEKTQDIIKQVLLFDNQAKHCLYIPSHATQIDTNQYISKNDNYTKNSVITKCYNQKNPAQTVYRINSNKGEFAGLIIEDKKTTICQIYDNNGYLIEVDKPLDTSSDETNWYSLNDLNNPRLCDMIDIVAKRMSLYQYAYGINKNCPTYENRLTKQIRFDKFKERKKLEMTIAETDFSPFFDDSYSYTDNLINETLVKNAQKFDTDSRDIKNKNSSISNKNQSR